MVNEEEDIFRLMDKIFGGSGYHTPSSDFINYRESERIIDKDCIYYTLVLKDIMKDEIDVKSFKDHLLLIFSKGSTTEEYKIDLPYSIDPKSIKAKYNNGLLDITVHMSEEAKADRVEIE